MSGRPQAFDADSAEHAVVIDAYFVARGSGRSTAVVDALGVALGAIWERAQRTLGAVTLAAIADRVLHGLNKEFPFVGDLTSSERGIVLDALRARAEALPREQLDAAARAILVRFLSVLGNLTADVLTPALHDELARLRDRPASHNDGNSEGEQS